MSIAALPIELVNRIITIGCEELPFPFELTDLKPRRLKEFAETASTVCREWRFLVFSSSNYHLWRAELVLPPRESWRMPINRPYRGDIATDISIFKDILSKSRRSDLDILLAFPKGSKLTESLMVHVLALIARYSCQIRIFDIFSRPLRKIVSALERIQPLPRLARFQLQFSSGELVDSPDDVFSLRPDSLTLDLSTENNCRDVRIDGTWALKGGMLLPINSLSSLVIDFTKTDVTEWRGVAMLLEARDI